MLLLLKMRKMTALYLTWRNGFKINPLVLVLQRNLQAKRPPLVSVNPYATAVAEISVMRAACRRAFSRGRNDLRALENLSKLKLYKGENLDVAIQTAEALEQQRIGLTRNDAYILSYILLQESGKRKDLGLARAVQSLMCRSCLGSTASLQELLIRSFAHHKCLLEASQAFDIIGKPTAYSWAVIIMANAKLGQALLALELCYRIEISGSRSGTHVHVYVAIFKACLIMKTIPYARITHEEVIENVQNPNVVCWNALINGYMQRGQKSLALDCIYCVLQAAPSFRQALLKCRALHQANTIVSQIFPRLLNLLYWIEQYLMERKILPNILLGPVEQMCWSKNA